MTFSFSNIAGAALLLALPALTASAATLSYVGNTISGTAGSGRIEAQFTFATPLTNGANLTLADVTSWSMVFTADGVDITNATASFAKANFVIGPGGTPTNWGFASEQDYQLGADPETIVSYLDPPFAFFGFPVSGSQDFFGTNDGATNDPGAAPEFSAEVIDNPGSWTTVPEPSAAALLLFFASGLIVRRRRG